MKIKGGSVCIVCSRKEQCKISSAAVEIPCYFWYLTSAEKTARTTGLFDFCYVFLSSYSYVTLTLVIKPLRMCHFSTFSPVFLKGNFVFLCIFELWKGELCNLAASSAHHSERKGNNLCFAGLSFEKHSGLKRTDEPAGLN